MTALHDELPWRPTACVLCSINCGLEARVAGGGLVKIRGDRAQYDYTTDTITITGDVILSRGNEGVVRGTQVVYRVGEGRTIITAGAKRVTSIFTPASKRDTATTPPATTPAPAAPARHEQVSPRIPVWGFSPLERSDIVCA